MRQRKLYDASLDHSATVIGCGSLGSFILYGLAKMGIKELQLYDFDQIEVHNLPNQFFSATELGKEKVIESGIIASRYATHQDFKITATKDKWSPLRELKPNLIVNAPDCIDTRKLVMENAPKNSFIVDVRSGGEQFNIFCADTSNKKDMEFYSEQFFAKEEAKGTDCSAQATVYNSMLIASLAVDLYVKWAMKKPYPNMIEGCAKNFVFTPLWLTHQPED